MTRGRLLTASVKEFREIAPVALCGLAVVAALGIGVPPTFWLSYATFCAVALALGAMSIGHEYRHGTLAVLLAQPGTRLTTLSVKLSVLVGLLALLTLASRLTMDARVFIPLVCALFLAPWLTMICRSELAGAVFAAAVPAFLFVGVTAAARLAYGLEPGRVAETHVWRMVGIGMALAAVCGALGTVSTFLRLQAIDGDPTELHWPRWLTRDIALTRVRRPLNPYLALVRKEIRLHGLVFGLAALFVLAWIGVAISEASSQHGPALDMRAALGIGYSLAVLLLLGASASAEERRLGTIPAQMLTPIAAWKQFTLKIAVLIVLLILLVPVLLITLEFVTPFPPWRQWPIASPSFDASAVGLLCVGIYVSSLSASTLRAFIASLAALVVPLTAFSLMLWPGQAMAIAISHVVRWSGPASVMEWWALRSAPFLLSAGLGVLLLRLALCNHRAGLLTRRAVERQVGMVLLCVMLAALLQATLASTVQVASFWRLYRRAPTASELSGSYRNLVR